MSIRALCAAIGMGYGAAALALPVKQLPAPGDSACALGRLNGIQRGALGAVAVVVVRNDQSRRVATESERGWLSCKGATLAEVFAAEPDRLHVIEVRFDY